MMNKTVLILGASSDIAMAVGKTFAKNKHPLILAARNTEKLLPYIYDLQIRFQINIDVIAFDATDFNSHKEIINRLPNECETAICAVGYMGNQEQAIIDTKETLLQIQSNYTGLVNILNHLSNHWKQNSIQGKIIGITSVAGERGRMSNYIYGSAKAGFTTYLSGLRNELYHQNLKVLTVKLGFAKTKMTDHLNLPKPLTVSPDKAADLIYKSFLKRKDSIYILPIWRWVMFIIKIIPEKIFKKLKL